MDGTLTPAREEMPDIMLEALRRLDKKFNIGIVSGSDMDYIEEQCHKLLSSEIDLEIYPCNGTRKFLKKGKKIVLVEENNMINEIGESSFKKLSEEIIRKQLWLIKNFKENFSFTGTYIQYRGSMVNWCMCGRNSQKKERDLFSKFDKENGIRKILISMLSNSLGELSSNLDFAIGGSTSIDIYPKGWDKTFCLKNFEEENTFFVGDACLPGQNDFEIYKKLSPRSFSTESVEETIEIINKILEK